MKGRVSPESDAACAIFWGFPQGPKKEGLQWGLSALIWRAMSLVSVSVRSYVQYEQLLL
jgi:hypothetical protein